MPEDDDLGKDVPRHAELLAEEAVGAGVLTFPDFARRSHGIHVVEAATNYIAAAGADIGLTTCEPALGAFYAQADWMPLANTTLLFGDVTSPVAVDELVLMLFVSEKGKRARQSFEGRQVYVGANTW